jgi:hypothetical protein
MRPAPNAYESIECERGLQDAKWDEQNHDDPFWLCIVSEEFGEVGKAIIEAVEQGHDTDAYEEHLRYELVQVAACCVAWIEAIERRQVRRFDQPHERR